MTGGSADRWFPTRAGPTTRRAAWGARYSGGKGGRRPGDHRDAHGTDDAMVSVAGDFDPRSGRNFKIWKEWRGPNNRRGMGDMCLQLNGFDETVPGTLVESQSKRRYD